MCFFALPVESRKPIFIVSFLTDDLPMVRAKVSSVNLHMGVKEESSI